MDKRRSEQARERSRQRMSVIMTGRVPWNKGVGLEHPSIRRSIITRKANAALRELIRSLYTGGLEVRRGR